MKGKIVRFLASRWGVFLLGAIIGILFFGAQFGFSVVNPMATDWIWHDVTHDTAQHYIGWEFFRADSSGGIINGLAYPEGLPITFMDAIPLIALPLKLLAGVLPAGFQYFGLWALICYVLIGGLGAVLVRKIWRKVFTKNRPIKKAVAYYIKNENGDFTAVKRLNSDESLPGVWGLPAASLREKETFRMAVQRGAREKLGMEILKMKFVGEMEIARENYDLHLREYQILEYENEPNLQQEQTFYAQFKWQKNSKILREAAEKGSLCSRIFLKNLKLWHEKDQFLRMQIWQILFVAASALIFALSPMVLARTLYHPALAAHWLILLGILLIWDAPKFAKWWKFVLVWSAMLIGAVLIHPYFLPMLCAMIIIAALRAVRALRTASSKDALLARRISNTSHSATPFFSHFIKAVTALKFISKVAIPAALSVLVFYAIGGFALGSGAEIHDLHEKGFNLLSFANPSGYSTIPGFANASYSSETLMWLGLGVWAMIITAAIRWRGRYKKSFKEFKRKFAVHKARNIAIAVVAFGLLVFAIGVRVDVGPLAVFKWQPPERIYEFWSAFRAAAREAWPFYYATILAAIYWFSKTISAAHSNKSRVKNFTVVAVLLLAVSLIQFADIWFSKNATTRRDGFAVAQTTEPRFVPIDIDDLVTTQKHLVMLDGGFRYDQNGTYEIARTALKNNLTLNIGFFARIPDPIWKQQTAWREKVKNSELTNADLRDYIFATTNEKLVVETADNYTVTKRGKFYFITLVVR